MAMDARVLKKDGPRATSGRNNNPHPSQIVSALPATIPFVAPEEIERKSGKPLTLRLGANESAFGVSPRAHDAMAEALQRISWYGDPENSELRNALAAHHGVGIENIVVGNGIDGLLGVVVRAYLDLGDGVVTSLGTYPTFNYHVTGFGGRLHRVSYNDDQQNLVALAEMARKVDARLVYLANPDNPSGTWHPASDIKAFIDKLPSGCMFICDEAYSDFMPPGTDMPVNPIDPRVVRFRTFSKAHGMAGARIGYTIACESVSESINKIRSQFEVNRVAQAGALASLADREFVATVVDVVADGRRALDALAAELGLATIPSTTNFVCIDVGGAKRAREIVNALAERGVFIRMPGAEPLNRCIRVTVGTPEQIEQFAGVFKDVWKIHG